MICKYCNSPLQYSGTGRLPEFCSNAHRQAHYRLRKNDYQRQRKSAALKLLVLRNDELIRNANLPFSQPSSGACIFQQVDWTL